MKDLYEILGVNKDAQQEEIKQAYRNLCKKHHPDAGGDEEMFKKINSANEILSDPDKRRNYDQTGNADGKPGFGGFNAQNMNMEDLMSTFFGGGFNATTAGFGGFNGGKYTRHQQRGSDLRMKVSLTLDEIVNGVIKKIKYRRYDKCSTCDGKGAMEFATCKGCGGSGMRVQTQQTPIGRIQNTTVCNLCSGEGKLPIDKCRTCHTKGIVFKDEEFDIEIPAGATKDILLTKPGMGNCVKDGVPGNLIIVIEEIEHPILKRNGNNLECVHQISIPDAILGSKFNINSINENIEINTKSGCQSGDVITLKGKGIPNIENRIPGDMLVTIKVKIPKKISTEEKSLIENLRDSKNFKI